jgi:archaellum component FlaF (FlaF/FlaG flagellin family)
MKKVLLIATLISLTLLTFSAKFIFFSDLDNKEAHYINVENFDKITYSNDNLVLTVFTGGSSSSNKVDLEIPFTNDAETKKLEKVQYLITNGYVVSAKDGNKYFGNTSARNLTVPKIKEVKFDAFTNDFYNFLNSNQNFFNINTWLIEWVGAIPVSLN